MWCIPPQKDAAFVCHMEDVLEVYQRPYNPLRPQVCLDEAAKQLLGEGLDRALEQERHFQSTLFLTEDFAEGRAAFLGKRQPQFKGG